MTSQIASILSMLCCFASFGQIKGTVVDGETKQAVPYVNIWIAGQNKGTTADENGYFSIPDAASPETVLFSAVGYDDAWINAGDLKDQVFLNPKTILLSEVVITKSKAVHRRVINDIGKMDVNYFGKLGELPEMMARYIPYRDEYASTPFINRLRIACSGPHFKTLCNIRLYKRGVDGMPGESLYDDNVLVSIKKNQDLIDLDLSKYGLHIPDEGFFVAVEWLIIKQNRSPMYKRVIDDNGKEIPEKEREFMGWHYSPAFGSEFKATGEECYFFTKGQWRKEFPYFNEKYYALAAEVTLTD